MILEIKIYKIRILKSEFLDDSDFDYITSVCDFPCLVLFISDTR